MGFVPRSLQRIPAAGTERVSWWKKGRPHSFTRRPPQFH